MRCDPHGGDLLAGSSFWEGDSEPNWAGVHRVGVELGAKRDFHIFWVGAIRQGSEGVLLLRHDDASRENKKPTEAAKIPISLNTQP